MQKKLFLCCSLLLFSSLIFGAETVEFFRLTVDENTKKTRTLDTAVVTFKAKDGATVDLIAAIHIGDSEYYEELNSRFKDYDVVLYELIAPEGTRLNRERVRRESNKKGNVIGDRKSVV